MRPFAYERPETIDQALSMLSADGDATRPLAGGTDLLTLIKGEIVEPDLLVDIKRLDGLSDRIEPGPDGTRIGALVTLTQLETDPHIMQTYGALAQAAGKAATPQLRNMATIGGNVLQRPRCWYYRESEIPCWLKGGDTCPARDGQNAYHAIFDESPCVAVHPSDSAAALIALGATVHLRGSDGDRSLPLAELMSPPTEDRRRETTLRPGELITGYTLPPTYGKSVYLKAMDRKAWAFALVGVAAHVTVANGAISDVRLVLGGVANVPRRATAAENLLRGKSPSDDLFRQAAEVALEGATPLKHNAYKIDLTRALIQRALSQATA
ncbi:MAG TPA: xanthine dehydrogenase family protein subunit M [Thermomicrobiales bacterium]|jgi:xanthine dehydrogenase YagS FAD-binding subunit|nr:xanthine dehydrogenase family protein subunit M [Thermomicrobiales bacterium]